MQPHTGARTMHLRHMNLAASPGGELFRELLPWLGALLVIVIVGGALMYLARRFARGSSWQHDAGFTLQDLRQLHEQGELSDEQFERARARMIASVRGTTDNPEPIDASSQRNESVTTESEDDEQNDASRSSPGEPDPTEKD